MNSCPICYCDQISETFEVKEMMFGSMEKYIYKKCGNCGVLQLSTPVYDDEKIYPSNYYSFNYYKSGKFLNRVKSYLKKKIVQKELGSKNIVALLVSLFQAADDAKAIKDVAKKNKAILDVGCGTGALIYALAQNGYTDVTGVDPFISHNILGKGFNVFKKYLSELGGEKKYDLIMMHHSLEHMDDPLAVLKEVKKLLVFNGTCLIRVPVSDSFAFETYKSNWVQFDAPRHIFLHTDKSLNFLAEMAGLEIYQTVNDSTKFQFLGSEQYLRNIPLVSDVSYFVSPYKKLFFNKKHMFTKKRVREFEKMATDLNRQNRGDQRAYFLRHSSKK